MLRKNIGSAGRLLRFSIGLGLLWLAYDRKSYILLFFALFTFFEAFMSWCVVYAFLGINRCPKK